MVPNQESKEAVAQVPYSFWPKKHFFAKKVARQVDREELEASPWQCSRLFHPCNQRFYELWHPMNIQVGKNFAKKMRKSF